MGEQDKRDKQNSQVIYNTEVVCSYKTIEDGFLSDEKWREDFLAIFCCSDGYDDEIIDKGLAHVRDEVKASKLGDDFLKAAWTQGLPRHMAAFVTSESLNEQNELLLIRSYFTWPTMDLMHKFVTNIKKGNELLLTEVQEMLSAFTKEHSLEEEAIIC
jgi:hypothetical protein